MGKLKDLDYFFEAKSIAVIGASTKPGKVGHEILRSIVESEYKGRIYPIHPTAEEILGLKVYPNILDVPDDVELAVVATSAKITPKIIEECGRKGVKAVVIISGGFKESGEEGARYEREVLRIAKKYGMRLIGPNCIGIYNPANELDTFFQSRERMLRPPDGPIAFMTQSGTFGCAFLEWAAEEGVGISKFVSFGNRIDVDEADLITYFREDPDTRVIAIYTESVKDGRKLIKAIKETTPYKPIIILKAGRTVEGSKAALSHTGWLAGSYKIYSSAIRQAGAIEVNSLRELYAASKALAMQQLPKTDNIAMVTNGAGPCVMAIDMLTELGLKLAEYKFETVTYLKRALPRYVQIGNPVDLTGSATSKDYEITLKALDKDDNVGIILVFFVFQDTPLDEGIVEVMGRKFSKPILAMAAGGPYTRKMSLAIQKKGVPLFSSPEEIVIASYALISYSHIIKQKKEVQV